MNYFSRTGFFIRSRKRRATTVGFLLIITICGLFNLINYPFVSVQVIILALNGVGQTLMAFWTPSIRGKMPIWRKSDTRPSEFHWWDDMTIRLVRRRKT